MKSVTTVLFVENDAVALTMYQKRLQREGFHVETAEDGIAALRVLSEMTPDIVILDLMLPKFSGKDVFDYMRADKQFKKVPVIIFSNAPRTEWPENPDNSPTRALPKSEANFASLLELIKEMTTTPEPAAISAPAEPVPVPAAPVAAAPAPPIMAATPPPLPAATPPPLPATPVPLVMAATPPPPPTAAPKAEQPPAVVPPLVVQTSSTTETAVEASASAPDLTSADSLDQFLEYATAEMATLREHCLAFIKSPSTAAGKNSLSGLRRRLQAVDVGAQKCNCARLALLAGAWDALLAEIERKPSITSPSILQTLAQAADCLRILLAGDSIRSMEPLPRARVLSVDDDEICNHAAVSALEKANMNSDSVLDGKAALELLKQNNYDMVLLDINMPGLTGFELCEKLRALPQHQKTPVIFVTAYNNFENRKQSVLSGGGDLIAKPVSPLELALKVTIHLLKAPPKTASVPAGAKPEPVVWKEPVEKISHDTKVLKKSEVKSATPTPPKIVAPTTETLSSTPAQAPTKAASSPATAQPGPIKMSDALRSSLASPAAPAASASPASPAAPIAPTAPAVPASPKAAAAPATPAAPKAPAAPATPATPTASKAPVPPATPKVSPPAVPAPTAATPPPIPKPSTPPPVPEPARKPVEAKPVLDSAAQARPLPKEGTVVPNQPARKSQTTTTAPASSGGSKPSKPMNQETNQQFDTLVLDVAHIIFGDNAPDINVRLVRMALEQVWQNRANLESIDSIAREIARIIFGESSANELNTRLVKMALERSNSIALFKAA